MSHALVNSLQLLNEIRDQLHSNKKPSSSSLISSQNPKHIINNNSNNEKVKTPKKTINASLSPAKYTIPHGNGPEVYNSTISSMNDDEPLRSEFAKRPIESKIIKSSGSNANFSPYYPNSNGNAEYFSNYTKTITSPIKGDKNPVKFNEGEQDIPNSGLTEKATITISPYRRKFVQREQLNPNFNPEKVGVKVNEIAENMKRIINKELDDFTKECDMIKEKILRLLPNESRGFANIDNNIFSIPQMNNNSNSNQDLRLFNKQQSPIKKSTSEGIPFDKTMNTISKRIDKLMGDIEEKKVAALTIKAPIAIATATTTTTTNHNLQKLIPYGGIGQQDMPYGNNLSKSKISSDDQQYSFEADKY